MNVKSKIKEIEIFWSKLIEWHDAFEKMQFEKRLLVSVVVIAIGISGFCLSVFGLIASTCLLMTNIAFVAFLYSFYVFVK